MITTRIVVLVLLGFLLAPLAAATEPLTPDSAAQVQQTWKLLDYVATDYAGAVRNGAVIDKAEFAEQQEFSRRVVGLLQKLPASPRKADLRNQAEALVQAVDRHVPPSEVATRAHALGKDLLSVYPVPSAPTQVPDVAQGATLYRQHCAACHGATGDGKGPAGLALNPPPIDFTDAARADLRSPLSLYQALSQGIDGTAMQGYADTLSRRQRWALAYYVGSLAYTGDAGRGQQVWRDHAEIRADIGSLEGLSHARVAQLAKVFGVADSRAVIGWLRAHPQTVLQAPQGIDLARAKLAASVSAYGDGRVDTAARLALSAYLDGVEPEEPRLDARNHGLRSRIETAMGAYRTALTNRAGNAQVESKARKADALLLEAQDVLDRSVSGPATVFVGAYTIMVREGLEALLVVVALLAFLRKAEQNASTRYVHYGWVLALVAGGGTWLLARYVISISGANRELTEGLSSLGAAIVLLGVGLWMHQKSVGGRWQQYLKQKMSTAVKRGSAWFLFALAFVSVYREMFETILFYAALWGDGHHLWMLAGLLAAGVTLAVIAWVMLRTSRRLPLGQFFAASSVLMALLAFVMTGKGIAALQEAGWIDVSVAGTLRLEWLGIYPTWESLLAQLLVVVLLVAGFTYNVVRGRRALAVQNG